MRTESTPTRPPSTGSQLEATDQVLMAAVAEGDGCAFETLVLRHQQNAWNVAYRFLGDKHQAEDAVQDAFLRVYEASGRYRSDGPFTAYLRKIVVRRCIDYSRKRRPFLAGLFQTHPVNEHSPDTVLSRRERLEHIRDAVGRLPDRQRMAVLLKYLEGLDTRETADAMGTTPKAVERLLARARTTLGRELEELRDEGSPD